VILLATGTIGEQFYCCQEENFALSQNAPSGTRSETVTGRRQIGWNLLYRRLFTADCEINLDKRLPPVRIYLQLLQWPNLPARLYQKILAAGFRFM
jgi:hypothetical protein